jgi:predicted dehydrogenase
LAVVPWSVQSAGQGARLRAAIIGHTGRGDYGHGYDQAFAGLPEVEVVAVADPDPEGARRAAARAGAARTYSDYRELLAREKPQLVSIAMRHPRLHRAIALDCIAAGAHFLIEKPLTETLAEADEIVAAADGHRTRTVVAHNRRYAPEFQRLKGLLDEGFAGEIREIQIHGKQDARAGGEDLVVLGTHDFDLLRFCFGDPLWCSATILVDGRPATAGDARDGREPIRVLGDTIRAQFGFRGNLAVNWASVKAGGDWNQPRPPREHWSWEILGTRRIIAYQSGAGLGFLDSPYLLHPANDVSWQPLPDPGAGSFREHQRSMARDLLHAVATGEPTLCSVHDGRWAIEMLTAVYRSHLLGRRVEFPLNDRTDPLA